LHGYLRSAIAEVFPLYLFVILVKHDLDLLVQILELLSRIRPRGTVKPGVEHSSL
jgi:hypothetical protein